jgi:hypothetical protein
MPDEPRKPQEWEAQVIQRLVKEIGITAEEARELVSVFGKRLAVSCAGGSLADQKTLDRSIARWRERRLAKWPTNRFS